MHLQEQARSTFLEASALVVTTVSHRQRAADLWDAIRAFRKQAEGQKEETCRPLKTAWEEAKQPFDAFTKECQAHEARLQGLMGTWDREQDRLAREEQAKIQAKIDAENAKRIQKAEAKGIEPVLKAAPVVPLQPKSIETQAGTTQTRQVKKVYRIKGVKEKDADIRASDTRDGVVALLKDYPALFALSWPAFNKLASTGLLDDHSAIDVTEEYVYAQRQAR